MASANDVTTATTVGPSTMMATAYFKLVDYSIKKMVLCYIAVRDKSLLAAVVEMISTA